MARAGDAQTLPGAERTAAAAAPVQRAEGAGTALTQQAIDLASGHWRWLWVLAGMSFVALVWIWRARYGTYDKDGLPRGPRL